MATAWPVGPRSRAVPTIQADGRCRTLMACLGAVPSTAGKWSQPFSRYTCPTLTTVSQDHASITEKSVETLFRLIDSGERARRRETTLYDGTPVMRGSA